MTLRWGIIGCGDVVRKRVAAAINDDEHSELTALCRRNQGALAEFGAAYQSARLYTDWRELIGAGEIDAVYVATPVALHREQTMAAAAAGLHVLVEKPMAMNGAECQQMIDACQAANVRLGVAYYRRFYPVYERIKQLVRAGEIGDVLHVDAVTATPFLFRGDEEGAWRVDLQLGGGGALMDIGSHRLNLFLDLLGEPDQVRGVCSRVAVDHPAENCAILSMTFQNGATAAARVFFGSEVDPDEFSVLGTRGRLISAPLNGGELRIESTSGERIESHAPADNFNAPQIADFAEAVQSVRAPRVAGAEGALASEVMERCYRDAGVDWV